MLKTTLKCSLTLVTLVGASLSSNGAEWDATNNPWCNLNYRLLPSLIADNMARDAGDRFPGNFGMPILNGADAIRAELDDLEEPLPNPLWPPPMARDAIYFGGTDYGRFIPESMTLNDGIRPDVLVVTQNALADGRYTDVLRHRLSGKCWVPPEDDCARAFETYISEVQSGKRQSNGDLKIENGRVHVTGALAIMQINEIISRDIFDHNKKEHDFYVEESYVIPWMYDYLTPHGFVMKLNAEPVGRLYADACVADREFWDWQTRRLLDDPQFCRRWAERWRMEKDDTGSHEDYDHRVACRAFSKTRTSIAGLYARKGLMQEAQAAFREAYMIDPQSPEVIFRSIQEVLALTGKWNAIFDLIEHADRVNPNNKKRTEAMRGPVRAARDAKITMDDLRGKYREQIEKNKNLEDFSPENLGAFSPDDLDRLADACLDDCDANLLFGNFQMARRSALWAHGNPARAKTFKRSWRLAKIFKLLSQTREAAENVQAALKFPEANTFEVQHEAALILAQADNEDCVMVIQRALAFPESKNFDTLVQYAKILERFKKRPETIKTLNLALPLATNAPPPSITDAARLMLKLNATKYMPNAQCLLRPLLRRSDVSWTPETLVDYALVCYSAQMPDYAYAGFSNAIRMNPASVDALFKKWPALKSIWQELEKQQQQHPQQREYREGGGSAGDTKTFTLPGGLEMEMVYVAPGSFTMGSPESEAGREKDETQHRVTLTKGFWIGKYPVTQRQWQALVRANGVSFAEGEPTPYFSRDGKGRDFVGGLDTSDFPMENISWNDCRALVDALNKNERGEWHWSFPTEAQWEFAARGGTKSRGYIYSGGKDLDALGWYYENSGTKKLSDSNWNFGDAENNKCRTHSVKEKDVGNELGIVGMSGNVCEWCADWYGDYPEGSVTDPKGLATGEYRVLRGGSWDDNARDCRSAYRNWLGPGFRNFSCGFRLCCSAGPRGEAERGGRVPETPPKRSGRRPARVGAHGKVQLWEGGPYWAETNIGAEKPEDYGYYFWWGDTVGYKRDGDAWVASDGSSRGFKFDEKNAPTYGKSIDALKSEEWLTKDGVLAPKHDAAHVHWGGDWRMPTRQELKDLKEKCYWIWTTLNGVEGSVVKGKGTYASASIFLPSAGYGLGTSLGYSGLNGAFWSSVPYSGNSDSGFLIFDLCNRSAFSYYYRRDYGFSIRPVQGFAK